MVIEHEHGRRQKRESIQPETPREVVLWQSPSSLEREAAEIQRGIFNFTLASREDCPAKNSTPLAENKVRLLPPSHFNSSESKNWLDLWSYRFSKKG